MDVQDTPVRQVLTTAIPLSKLDEVSYNRIVWDAKTVIREEEGEWVTGVTFYGAPQYFDLNVDETEVSESGFGTVERRKP